MSLVILFKTFKYRAYPSYAQEARALQWTNVLRMLWNIALEQRLIHYRKPKSERNYLNDFDQINQLTELRAEHQWIADVQRDACAELLRNLHKSWMSCFNKLSEPPKFKKKNQSNISICIPHPKTFRLQGSTVIFPKLGSIRIVMDRMLEGKPKTCTLARDVDQWFVSIKCEITASPPKSRLNDPIGIDRGIAAVAADSNGNLKYNPYYYINSETKLVRAQRKLSNKKKGSQNYKKQAVKVAKVHRKIRRQREWFLHDISSKYTNNHGVIVIEDLKTANMVKNQHLAKSILDVGWGELERQLKYKQEWSGGTLVKVPAYYSSQTCSRCGHCDEISRRSQSLFVCTKCNYTDNADVNAAKVILSRRIDGVAVCGGSGALGLPAKQKSKPARSRNKPLTLENY